MLYTTYFAKVKQLPDNVIPVAICAKAPTGFKGYTYMDMAPKYDFFKHFKETGDVAHFTKCYKEQVLDKLNPIAVENALYTMVDKSPFTHDLALVCYEKPTDFCHRQLVSEWFNSKGIPCKEFI